MGNRTSDSPGSPPSEPVVTDQPPQEFHYGEDRHIVRRINTVDILIYTNL